MEGQVAVLVAQTILLVQVELVMYHPFLHHKEIQAEAAQMDRHHLLVEVAVVEVILPLVQLIMLNLLEAQEEMVLQTILLVLM